jgi:nicotinate-nucleotide--dimethylbenzimidazole phosphoribosyltransferase
MTRPDVLEPEAIARFSDEARRAIYDVIALRRDVRHFVAGEDVDPDTLKRVLGAAHLAPSVGFSQPWGFVVVRDAAVRQRIRESFLTCRQAEAARFPADRREQYLSYRLEGIVEASLNVCVVVDLRPREEAILGTTVQPEAVRASACCAVQNLWLAARAEGLGVGWVSIVEPQVLRHELALPAGVEPVAYLCVGRPVAFRARPMLEELGWRPRRALDDAVHADRWREAVTEVAPDVRLSAADDESTVPPLDPRVREAARVHQDLLTKPRGSLGRLEDLAVWYASARGRFPVPVPKRTALAMFMGDHGVVTEGVSAYGSQVTAAMACNVMAGGAACSVLARHHGVDLVAVDVGIAGDLSSAPVDPLVPLVRARVRPGTRNMRVARAMDPEEARAAFDVGSAVAERCARQGVELAAVGEIGIGNTTAAAALVSVFTGAPPEQTCGRGTGVDDATLARKVHVVRDALEMHGVDAARPMDALCAVGGLEIAAAVGFLLRASAVRLPVLLDGFVTCAAALVAFAMEPAARDHWKASHASAESGARLALARLELEPLLDLGMRLGEGTGALVAVPLVQAAVELQVQMATFATAGVVRRP